MLNTGIPNIYLCVTLKLYSPSVLNTFVTHMKYEVIIDCIDKFIDLYKII